MYMLYLQKLARKVDTSLEISYETELQVCKGQRKLLCTILQYMVVHVKKMAKTYSSSQYRVNVLFL